MVKVQIKGQEKEADIIGNVCYQIPAKEEGKRILVARVKAGEGKKGGTLIRFARVLDPSACDKMRVQVLNRRVPKLVIGKREYPKGLRLISGAGKKMPASIYAKLMAAIAKKQAKSQKKK